MAAVVTACLAPRHDGEPADAEPHATLCGPCRRGLSRDLRRLPGLHADLEHLLATGQAHGHGNGNGLPFNDPVSDCRSQIRHDLTHWARHVTELRGLDAPPVLGGDWAGNPVAVMAGWLHGQVVWCTFRDWAGDMAGALAEDAGRARALLDPWVTASITIPRGRNICPACDARNTLSATVYKYESDQRPSVVECSACGHRWDTTQWLRLGHLVMQRVEGVPA